MTGEHLSAFMFINFEQALGFGHCAWGFEVAPGEYFYGSTDHLLRRPMWDLIALARYSSVPAGGDIDYWCGQGSRSDMLAEMSRGGNRIWYHRYKELQVPAESARPEQARIFAESLQHKGWRLWDNNCVHQTHRVLSTFGAGAHLSEIKMGRPWQVPPPVRFFETARGEACDLKAKISVRSCL